MTVRAFYKAIICAFALCFAALSFSANLHAMEYGDAPHEHEGVACMVTAVADEGVIDLPQILTDAPIVDAVILALITPPAILSYVRPHGRAPPPRSPPLSA